MFPGPVRTDLAYGVLCWRLYRGTRWLLAVIVLFNLANLSMFSAAIPGPEELLPERPLLLPALILAQIVVTLALTGLLARRRATEPTLVRPELEPAVAPRR